MPKLDFNSLFTSMVAAARASLALDWSIVKADTTKSLRTLAQNLVDIEKMKAEGTITEEKARLQVEMQKTALKTFLLTKKGLGKITVENTINAVLGAVGNAVNTAIGWVII